MREHRPKHRDLGPEQKKRAAARSYANTYLGRGKIDREDCSCGSPGEEMHHGDYTKPLDIKWFCRPCHLAHHASMA